MSGKPGRSGKARTPEERQDKRRFAKMGGDAAAGRPPTTEDEPDRPEGSVEHSPALLARYPEAEGYPFPVKDSLALKDMLECELKQAKAMQADVELDEARVKRDKERGLLRTLEWVRDRDAVRKDTILSHLPVLIDAALALHPPEQQPRARHAMDQAVAEFRRRVAESLRVQ